MDRPGMTERLRLLEKKIVTPVAVRLAPYVSALSLAPALGAGAASWAVSYFSPASVSAIFNT